MKNVIKSNRLTSLQQLAKIAVIQPEQSNASVNPELDRYKVFIGNSEDSTEMGAYNTASNALEKAAAYRRCNVPNGRLLAGLSVMVRDEHTGAKIYAHRIGETPAERRTRQGIKTKKA